MYWYVVHQIYIALHESIVCTALSAYLRRAAQVAEDRLPLILVRFRPQIAENRLPVLLLRPLLHVDLSYDGVLIARFCLLS
jgi:hypothetical protein